MIRGATDTVLDRAAVHDSTHGPKHEKKAGQCLESCSPCALVSFVSMLYKQFGGYVPMAVLTYCFNEGFAFPTAAMALKVYFLDVLGLDGPTSARYTLVIRVGWIAKPFVGMLSDALPLFGLRRSSYLAISCAGGVVAWTCLSLCNLSAKATFPFLVMAGLSLSIPDVMIDATTAELVKKAPEQASNTQTLNFTAFAVGGIISCSFSGLIVQNLGPRAAFMALNLGLLCLLAATLMRWLPEEKLPRAQRGLNLQWMKKHARLAGLSTCMSVAAVVLVVLQVYVRQSLARFEIAVVFVVIVPLGFYISLRKTSSTLARAALFIFLHGCLQPSYPDTMFKWMRAAKNGPHFNTVVLGWTDCFGSLGLLTGVFIYTKFLTHRSYRFIFTVAIASTVIPSVFDLALVKRWNVALHIPDIAMAIGDESFQNCVIRLFRMPVAVMAMKACPKGMEGSVMSLILSLGGFGHALGVLFGSCLLEVLDVKRGHYEHLPEALAVRGLCRLLPLVFLPILIPAGISPSDPINDGYDLEEGNMEENNDDSACTPRMNESSMTSDSSEHPRKTLVRPNPNACSKFERGTSAESDSTFAGFAVEHCNTDGFNRLVSASSVAPSEWEVHGEVEDASPPPPAHAADGSHAARSPLPTELGQASIEEVRESQPEPLAGDTGGSVEQRRGEEPETAAV